MAATRKRWYVGEDGCIPIGEPAASVTYHSSLSSIIVATKEPAIKVYDVTSGSVLQKSNLSAAKGDALHCVFLPKKDRIFFSDSRAVGVRKDLHGVLMLDTALQTPVAKTEEIVKLELPLAEAVQLLKSLSHAEISGIDFVDEVIKELGKRIEIAQEATKGNHKTIKWATVCLELQHCALKNVCSSLVAEMRRLNQHSPGLSIASTVTDRLGYLLPNSQPEITGGPVERTLMYSEAARRETFSKWPHMNYKWALPEPMAQAGFYHQPNSSGDDRAMCFTCSVCLVCWEPTDEPWSEHERHSPSCPYVKGEHTQNVPLSVTYATQPAMTHGDRGDRIECVSSTSCDKFMATSTRNGYVVIWDIGHILKKYSQFSLDPSETVVALKTGVQVERCPSSLSSHFHHQQQQEKDNNLTSTSNCKFVDSVEKQHITSLTQGAEGLDSTDAVSVKTDPTAPVTFNTGNDAFSAGGLQNTASEVDFLTPDAECKWKRPCEDVIVSSLCLVEKLVTQSSRTSTLQHNRQGAKQDNVATTPQPTLICGVSLRKSKLSINSEAPRHDAEATRTTDVQLMNKVNEVVSGDHSLQIIISSENNSDQCKCSPEEILNATSFLPYILVTSVCEDNKKLTQLDSTDSLKPVVSTSNIVPTLGALTMNQDWDLLDQMYYSDPDPDVQIIGFTPGPSSVSTSGPTEAKFALEGGHEESQGKTSSSVDGAIRKVTSIPSSGTILQCVELPEAFHFKDMEVRQILPTPDGHHILVIVSKKVIDSSHSLVSVISNSSQTSEEGYTTCCENSASGDNASVDSTSKTSCSSSKWGGILCYRLEFDSDCHYASINERPLAVYHFESADSVQTAVLLPQDISDQSEDESTDLVEGETSQGLEVSRKPVGSDSSSELQGLIAVIFSSGKLSVYAVNNFSLLAEISPPEEDRFTGVTYCSGLDRLCVCSALGKLYLYQLSEDLPESMENLLEAGGNSSPAYLSPSQTAGAKLKENRPSTQDLPEAKATAAVLDSRDSIPNRNRLKQGTGLELLAKQDLSFDNLVLLHQLTRFENLLPRFTATVPPCWNEIQQEQQQRRHPQHLQHQGEASQHTRTWKLQTDSNTWDEHLFEIVLPRMCCVGHVDVKFSFHPLCTSAPHIEMTLLKQNVSNLGRQSSREKSEESLASCSAKVNSPKDRSSTGDESGSIPVDNPINFGIRFSAANDINGSPRGSVSARNSVLDPLFLESHNAEILCGPINIATCLDLSGNCGQVSLTSPQLLLSKPRSFLLHIKGFHDKTDAPDKGKESRKRTSAPTSATSDKSKAKTIKAQFENYASAYGSASISGKFKLEHMKGCDWIQEISVTIRKTKKIHIQKDRLQRNAMLELTSFHEKLISIVALDESSILPHVSPDYLQNLVLDILMWITFIQMHDPDRRIFSKCILMTLQKHLSPLVKACFIQGTRTTAHKCAKLMALCMEFCKSAIDPNLAPSFSLSLLEAIMESLPLLPCAYSSGAVKWYFTLLNRVKCMDIVTVSESCADLLKNTALHYHSKTLPGHALLRSRYGVYGHPFEPDLFDMDLPVAVKQCQTTPSVPTSYASVLSSTVGGIGSSTAACDQQEELDFYDLFIIPSEKSSKAQIEYARNSILGMLEVEPLHFTCHSTSDGTKMEKLDSAGNNSTAAAVAASTGLNPTGLTGTINFGEGIPAPQLSQMSGTGMTYSLQSTMASAKHQLQELSMKNYPTVKHKIMHIKQILSEVGKAIPQIAKSSTASAELAPSTPKTTPQVMTPPLTPPNEAWHQLYLGGNSGSKGTPSGASQQQQQHQQQQHRMSVNVLQTQALLQPPTPQVLVVERMHSGARRFVILDFGKSILLTDVIIPACADLASLSIDVWVQQEEVDGQRLIVASDIGSRSLVMNDIMPPPVCRYLKLTTIGRYGSGTTRSRIPIGAFYGHSYILPWEWNSGSDQVGGIATCQLDLTTQSQLLTQLGSFLSLQEDIQCRYSLSRTRLENLLSHTDSSHYTTSHTHYYLQRGKKNNDEDNNIIQAYNECLQMQLQQNLAQRAIDRLKNAIGLRLPTSTTHTTDNLMNSLKHATIDKLRFLLECLLEVLLISTNPSASIPQPPISLYTALAPQGCEALFKHLCVHGTRRIQILASMLLVRVCGSQKWFGDFMGNMLQEFFQSNYSQVFPQDRLFVLLLAMGQRTLQGPAAVSMMESILGMLAKVLSPMCTGQPGGASALQAGNIDLSLVGWILLFLCRNLDNTFTLNGEDADRGAAKKDQGSHLPNRWNFIQAENTFGNKVQKNKSVKVYRRSLQKRLMHHKQKLIDLEQVKQSFMWQGDKSSQNISNSILKQQEKQFKKELSQYASKHLKDIIQIRKTDAEILRKLQRNPRATAEAGSDNGGTELDQDNGLLILPKTRCLSVVRGLIVLLLGMDFTCNVDLFLITCKVLARICVATRPAICLVEVMSAEQLKKLILLTSSLEFNHGNISWGGPWAGHALTCLLQDILEGERLYPVHEGLMEDETSAEGQTMGESDDIQQSGSLSTFEESDLSNGNGSSGEETVTQAKDDIGKLSFEKESSLMVDMLLDEEEYDDDTSDKLHAYVTGESIQPPIPPPLQVVQVKPWGNSSMNGGTLDMNNPILMLSEEEEKYSKTVKAVIGGMVNHKTIGGMSSSTNSLHYSSSVGQGLSTALDARLEIGLETQPELRLRVMLSLQTEMLQNAFSSSLPSAPLTGLGQNIPSKAATDDELSETQTSLSPTSSNEMLSNAFDDLFAQLLLGRVNLDSIIQLWLTLNEDGTLEEGENQTLSDSSRVPLIPLSLNSVSSLLASVATMPSLPVRTWVLVFQSLTLLANLKIPCSSDKGADTSPMANAMLADSNLIIVITKFLSGMSNLGPMLSAAQSNQVGPSGTKAFYEFLQRLHVKCADRSIQNLKELMLKLVYSLTADRGAFQIGVGPLDAQCKFLDFILDMSYDNVDISNAISVIESASVLVHQHILCQEKVQCHSSGENLINARSCFGGLFASLLRGGECRTGVGDTSRDLLMCSLLKLVSRLVSVQNSARGPRSTEELPVGCSDLRPMTDFTKLSQQVLGTATCSSCQSDEEKFGQTDEQKTGHLSGITEREGNHQTASESQGTHLADIILGHQPIMCNLIQALSYCNSNTMAMILGSRGVPINMQERLEGADPLSVGDGIYHILVMLFKRCSDAKIVLESLFHYLSGGFSSTTGSLVCLLSEPLLWYILKVLDSTRMLSLFFDMGGVKVVCRNIVMCNNRLISTSPSMVSTMMQSMIGKASSNDRKKAWDSESADGLLNFAPLGTITSSSPTASPGEVLIAASPQHRRARSAAWSYHFYPDEAWVDLTISLPFAILLKEVQIQPHSAALSTCPAHVSLEISHDGVTTFPLCAPMMTSSLASIKLQLQQLEVVASVTIRLHRARDSMTIGLSQILLMGYSAFGDAGMYKTNNIFLPIEDSVSRSSVGWLRLLHHCLTSRRELEDKVAEAAAHISGLLNTCTALLISPTSGMDIPHVETVLLKLGLQSGEMGLSLVDNLLRSPTYGPESGHPSHYLGKINGMGNNSTVELLYQLGMHQDAWTKDRIQAMLRWLGDSARLALQKTSGLSNNGFQSTSRETFFSLSEPSPAHVHCIASVLWHSHEHNQQNNFSLLISKEIISSLYQWSSVLRTDSSLKEALDYVLCSMCYIQSAYFSQILTWMGIISIDINMMAPIPDDRKDSSQYNSASMTDDSKEANNASREQPVDRMTSHHLIEPTPFALQDVKHICLDKSNLGTLSRVCKSPVAIKHLLQTRFPAVLGQGLFEFCNYIISQFTESWSQSDVLSNSRKTVNSVGCNTSGQSSSELNHKGLSITAATVASVLDFFSQISSENAMKDWFGGADGNIFWPVLLTMLCNIPLHSPIVAGTIPQKYELMSVEDRMAIETSTIRFFTHVVSCHVDNQMLFAKVLCDVIKEQGNTVKTGLSVCPLSGFTRRLLLQVLLEDEKVLVAFRADPSQHWTKVFNSANSVQHPLFGAGRQFRTVHVNMHTTFSELVNEVSDMAYLKAAQLLEKKPDDTKKDSSQVGLELVEYISSVNSESFSTLNTEKQEKLPSSAGSKSSLPPRPPTRRGRNTADIFAKQFQYQTVLSVYHPFFKHKRLPPGFSVSQLLQVLQQQECPSKRSLEFTLRLHMRSKDKVSSSTGMFLMEEIEDEADDFSDEVLLSSPPFPTALQVFASIGGLALLAEYLPLLYPEISRQITASDMHSSESAAQDISQEWVQLEPYPEEFYELYEPMSPAPQSGRVASHPLGTMPTIPPHSLVAFGLFLRLPGYAEVLLKERKKAQCLLRLVLGVTDNGNGGCILTSPISGALPTFPFLVLKSLYDNTPLTTDDGVLLRRMSQDIGVLHLILACLSVLSHHAPRVSSTAFQHETQILLSAMQYTTNPSSSQSATNSVEEKALQQQQQQQQHYWAKGTGFGTGSTTSSWDAEQALLRQKSEEEHVTCLLQVLASFINPGGYVPDDFFHESYVPSAEKSLPDIVPDLLSQSCLVPALSSYLRNDSVLDMARHVPLYRALLELMRGLAMCPAIVHLLMPLDKQASSRDTGLSVGNLLEKMRGCVDTYANRLKGNKIKAGGGSREEEEENEGLALLIPDIQETARIVHLSTERLSKEEDSKRGAASNSDGDVIPRGSPSQKSLDDRYLAIMKRQQFDTYQMAYDEGSTIRFYVRHHYENNVKAAGDIKNPARIRRLAQEAVTLSTSLPLSVSSSVFVRCDEDRLDIMKVLITGPEDTPYANGCFEFDVYFPQDYPIAPPYINLETTGNHTVRFNPNLYNDGKVCLSILNTWHGRPEEKWNSQTSSFLQVLVSIQSLILVSEPYFNEPGYERSRGTPSGTASSREYDANIRQATVKWAMLEQLRNPSPCFREVIQNHFWLKRHRILQQCQVWISEMETYSTDKRTGRTIAHSTMALKRHYNQLREEFARMKPPSGEEEESEEKIDPKEQQYDTDQATGNSQNGSPLLMLDILATDPNANSVMNPEAIDQIVCSVNHTELDTNVDLTEIDSCLNPPGVPDC